MKCRSIALGVVGLFATVAMFGAQTLPASATNSTTSSGYVVDPKSYYCGTYTHAEATNVKSVQCSSVRAHEVAGSVNYYGNWVVYGMTSTYPQCLINQTVSGVDWNF